MNQPSLTASLASGGLATAAAAYLLGMGVKVLTLVDVHFGLGGALVPPPDLVTGLAGAAGAWLVARMHAQAAATSAPPKS